MVTTNAKVSIIIPVYNVEKYLRKSIDSALNQTYKWIDIILIDDGSTDSCSSICEEYATKYQNVRVFHKQNGGLSSARNRGIQEVDQNTEYILFLDSDDELINNAVENLVRKSNEDIADVVYPDRYIKTYENGTEEKCFHFPDSMFIEDPKQFAVKVLIGEGRAWRAHSLLYSYALIHDNDVRFPEGHTAEDFSFNLQVLSHAHSLSFLTEPTVKYLKRSNSITTSFREDFDKEIWYTDYTAICFLQANGLDRKEYRDKVDDLLCRSLVTYIFKIMSSKNNMSYKDKKEMAIRLINDQRARNVVRMKRRVPYFSNKKKMICLNIVYHLFQRRLDSMALCLVYIANFFNKNIIVDNG